MTLLLSWTDYLENANVEAFANRREAAVEQHKKKAERYTAYVVDGPQDLAELSNTALVKLYNRFAEQPIQKFQNADVARQRTFTVLERSTSEEGAVPYRTYEPELPTGGGVTLATRRTVDQNAKIRLKTDGNPKREGTQAYQRFGLYQDGMTVKDFVDAGGTLVDVRWDLEHGFIELR